VSLYAQAVLAICGKRSKIVKDLLLCDGEIEHLIAFDELRSDCADNRLRSDRFRVAEKLDGFVQPNEQ
jgi:hypothetical protein